MSIIPVPEGSSRCRILVRHSKSVQDGPQKTRTLTPEGILLARRIAPAYRGIFADLTESFGAPQFRYSGLIRAALTGWEICHPLQLAEDPRLTLAVSLKKIPGEWYATQKAAGRTVPEMIRAVAADLSLLAGQPIDQRLQEVEEFMVGRGADEEHRLVVGFAHEPEPGLLVATRGWLTEGEAGLNECEAYIIFTDENHKVLSASTLIPLDPEAV